MRFEFAADDGLAFVSSAALILPVSPPIGEGGGWRLSSASQTVRALRKAVWNSAEHVLPPSPPPPTAPRTVKHMPSCQLFRCELGLVLREP